MAKVSSIGRLMLMEAALLAVGRVLGLVTEAGKGAWYSALHRSILTPPDWVFGVVWTLLYLMIGFAAWRLWERRQSLQRPRLVAEFFVGQMLLNWGWTPLFFTAHLLWLSFFWILALVILLCGLVSLLWREDRVSAWLFVPYTAWGVFAAYLSGTIAVLN